MLCVASAARFGTATRNAAIALTVPVMASPAFAALPESVQTEVDTAVADLRDGGVSDHRCHRCAGRSGSGYCHPSVRRNRALVIAAGRRVGLGVHLRHQGWPVSMTSRGLRAPFLFGWCGYASGSRDRAWCFVLCSAAAFYFACPGTVIILGMFQIMARLPALLLAKPVRLDFPARGYGSVDSVTIETPTRAKCEHFREGQGPINRYAYRTGSSCPPDTTYNSQTGGCEAGCADTVGTPLFVRGDNAIVINSNGTNYVASQAPASICSMGCSFEPALKLCV